MLSRKPETTPCHGANAGNKLLELKFKIEMHALLVLHFLYHSIHSSLPWDVGPPEGNAYTDVFFFLYILEGDACIAFRKVFNWYLGNPSKHPAMAPMQAINSFSLINNSSHKHTHYFCYICRLTYQYSESYLSPALIFTKSLYYILQQYELTYS